MPKHVAHYVCYVYLSRSTLWDNILSVANNLTRLLRVRGGGHAAGGAVGWGTALQTGRSRVRFPIVSLEIFIDIILAAAPGVDSASNRIEYQEYFLAGKGGRCLGLITLQPSCADYLEIWEPQPPGTLRTCPGL